MCCDIRRACLESARMLYTLCLFFMCGNIHVHHSLHGINALNFSKDKQVGRFAILEGPSRP